MRHFLLSIEQPVGGVPSREVLEPIMQRVEEFNAELKSAGAWVFAAGLTMPEEAAVATPDGDSVSISDGPYVDGDEHLGGLTVLAAESRAEALEWGRKLAAATTLPVEIRQFQGDPDSHFA